MFRGVWFGEIEKWDITEFGEQEQFDQIQCELPVQSSIRITGWVFIFVTHNHPLLKFYPSSGRNCSVYQSYAHMDTHVCICMIQLLNFFQFICFLIKINEVFNKMYSRGVVLGYTCHRTSLVLPQITENPEIFSLCKKKQSAAIK